MRQIRVGVAECAAGHGAVKERSEARKRDDGLEHLGRERGDAVAQDWLASAAACAFASCPAATANDWKARSASAGIAKRARARAAGLASSNAKAASRSNATRGSIAVASRCAMLFGHDRSSWRGRSFCYVTRPAWAAWADRNPFWLVRSPGQRVAKAEARRNLPRLPACRRSCGFGTIGEANKPIVSALAAVAINTPAPLPNTHRSVRGQRRAYAQKNSGARRRG